MKQTEWVPNGHRDFRGHGRIFGRGLVVCLLSVSDIHRHEARHTWNAHLRDGKIAPEDRAAAAGHRGTNLVSGGTYDHQVRPVVGAEAAATMDRVLGS